MKYQVKQNGLWGDRAVPERRTGIMMQIENDRHVHQYESLTLERLEEAIETVFSENRPQPTRQTRLVTGMDPILRNMSEQQMVEYLDTL